MKRGHLILFIFLSILSFPNIINLCKNYIDLNYDYQIIYTWEHSASIGLLPYRDIFYPYGFLSFYKGSNIIFAIIYYLITPILFTFLFVFINKVYKNRFYSYSFLLVLFIFILRYAGFDVFSRYGILIVFGYICSLLFYYQKANYEKKVFLLGLTAGIIFILYNDVGIYSCVLYSLFLLVDLGLKRQFKNALAYLYSIIVNLSIFITGFLLALIPFVLFLLRQSALSQFIHSFYDLSDLSQFAKIPFIHSISTENNIFVLVLMFITLTFLSYKLIYASAKPSFNNYLQISTSFALILVEQKNIVRSIDTQLTFIGVLLYILLFYEFKEILKKHKISEVSIFVYYTFLLILIVFIIPFQPEGSIKNTAYCKVGNTFYEYRDPKYESLKKIVQEQPDFNGKIFSFPGDTILYMVFKQAMSYYPTIYEASSISAQNKIIKYIRGNSTSLIIYNYKNYAIQDEVPNYIRSPVLHKFILNNYSITKIVDNFLILKKNQKQVDFFQNKTIYVLTDFKHYLLQNDLESIPLSEGLYKSKYLNTKNNKLLITTHSLTALNNYLLTNKVYSDNLFLAIELKNGSKKKMRSLIIKTKDDLETKITFSECERDVPCIIHLSRLPLFYKNRQLKNVLIYDENQIKNISIVEVVDDSIFW